MKKQVTSQHGVAKIEKAKKFEKRERSPKPKSPKRKKTSEEQAMERKALHMARVEGKAYEIAKASGYDMSKAISRGDMVYLQAELAVTQEEMTKAEKKRVKAENYNNSVIRGEQMSRVIRNEQRNIGRDIKATDREMSKLDPNSREYENLQGRRNRLALLQFEMRQKNVIDGETKYNSTATRLHAFEEYVTKFGGRAKLEEQREQIVNLSYSFGQETFLHRVKNFYKEAFVDIEDPEGMFERTPTYERLQWEMEMAVRAYDYDTVLDIVSQLSHGKKQFYSKYANVKNRSAREVK